MFCVYFWGRGFRFVRGLGGVGLNKIAKDLRGGQLMGLRL